MKKTQTGTWPGGFTRTTSDGRKVFYIHRRANGQRWKKALKASTEDAALADLALFLKDPAAFCAEAPAVDADEPLLLDKALVAAYLKHAAAPRSENGKENSRKWMKWKGKMLGWWASVLVDGRGKPLDLRRVELAKHVLPALEPVQSKRHRREAIKALYAWLAATGRVRAHEDPVARLPVGQGRVAQTQGGIDKRVPRADIFKVINHLLVGEQSRYGHALMVSAASGWHVTEVVRFVREGEIIEPVPLPLREPGVEAVLSTPHKSGKTHYTKVGADAARSAKALLAGRRGFSERHYHAVVRKACKDTGVTSFSPAWMRHTNATHALEQRGVSAADTGKFLGHADGSKMVDKVYAVLATAPKVPTILDEPIEAVDVAALVAEMKKLRREVATLRGAPAAKAPTKRKRAG